MKFKVGDIIKVSDWVFERYGYGRDRGEIYSYIDGSVTRFPVRAGEHYQIIFIVRRSNGDIYYTVKSLLDFSFYKCLIDYEAYLELVDTKEDKPPTLAEIKRNKLK